MKVAVQHPHASHAQHCTRPPAWPRQGQLAAAWPSAASEGAADAPRYSAQPHPLVPTRLGERHRHWLPTEPAQRGGGASSAVAAAGERAAAQQRAWPCVPGGGPCFGSSTCLPWPTLQARAPRPRARQLAQEPVQHPRAAAQTRHPAHARLRAQRCVEVTRQCPQERAGGRSGPVTKAGISASALAATTRRIRGDSGLAHLFLDGARGVSVAAKRGRA